MWIYKEFIVCSSNINGSRSIQRHQIKKKDEEKNNRME